MVNKKSYISSAFLLLISSVIVKVIGAVYKIPLTSFIGAVGRGYFASAYNVYMPLHAVIMGAFPIALSKLTGKYNALGDRQALSAIKKGAFGLFTLVGVSGMAVMLLLAVPYSRYISSSPKCIYTILVLAPSILFSAMAASYRGFYEGFMNMKPTAVSQTLEALFKMVFGLIFARLAMAYLTEAYAKTGAVLGAPAADEKQALSLIYPITSAAAMLGVTLGSLVSLIYVFVYYQVNKGGLPRSGRAAARDMKRELVSLSFPIMLSAAVQSVFQFVDTATVQYALGLADASALAREYAECISISKTRSEDVATYVYGLLNTSLDFKNLIPGITMALGICAVPAVSAAYEVSDSERLSRLINDIYKYTALLSVLGGAFLTVCSRETLELFYASSSPDIPIGCDATVKYFGLTVPCYCLAGTAVFCVQAIGRAEKSITPYVVCGIIRAVLNIILVSQQKFLLFGAVISGAVGYFIMAAWNIFIVKKYSKTKFDVKNVIIKPTIIGAVMIFTLQKLYNFAEFGQNLFINLLIKIAICIALFCILCFLLKAVDLQEFFCVINSKKKPQNTCN